MPQSNPPPILIPEGGLIIPASVWQASIIAILPVLAVVGVLAPVLFVVCGISWIVTTVWDLIDPPEHKKTFTQKTSISYGDSSDY